MNEKRLWNKIKKNIPKAQFTRIESSTMNGIPDVFGILYKKCFWLELKSDDVSYPALNKWQVVWINKHIKAGGIVFIFKETLLERSLKLYRPVSRFTDPRTLNPVASFSFPYNWARIQEQLVSLLREAA